MIIFHVLAQKNLETMKSIFFHRNHFCGSNKELRIRITIPMNNMVFGFATLILIKNPHKIKYKNHEAANRATEKKRHLRLYGSFDWQPRPQNRWALVLPLYAKYNNASVFKPPHKPSFAEPQRTGWRCCTPSHQFAASSKYLPKLQRTRKQ